MRTAREFSVDPNERSAWRGRWDGATLAERFWSHVDKAGGCWLWTAKRNPKGYGSFGIGSKRTALAHRVAWALERGPIPPRAVVLHSPDCRSRACVNPTHLRLGTQKENVADAMALGRMCFQRGLVVRGDKQWLRRNPENVIRDERGRIVGSRALSKESEARHV